MRSGVSPRGRRGALRPDRRGAVAVLFACALPLLVVAVGAGIEFSRLAAARAALQRAVDNAALSGAAAYVLYAAADSFKATAVSTANASFCKTVTALPAGAALVASTGTGAVGCNGGPGPTVVAAIGGYVPGMRGTAANTGCSATNTVVAGVTCGFLVTVSAAAAVGPTFGGLLGGTRTLTAAATAINPFLELGKVLAVELGQSGGWNANSIWVYPLRLDAGGNPDFAADTGARPPTTGCTGAPDQTRCGGYTMLASTYYQALGCTRSTPCTTADGTTFGGTGGIVQNPRASAAVITATTPLGFALESTSGGWASFGLDTQTSTPGCYWPTVTAYTTVTQVFPPTQTTRGSTPHLPPNNTPLSAALEGRGSDGSIDWTMTTRWFYSSFLTNNRPPSQVHVSRQLRGVMQTVQSVSSSNPPTACNDTKSVATTFPTSGATNCSLYIVKNPSSTQPNPDYRGKNTCWTPSATPGREYAALSCQGFAGQTFAFFWNDMGGFNGGDDTDYGNGTVIVRCSGSATVRLID